jgi:hypothetical protein
LLFLAPAKTTPVRCGNDSASRIDSGKPFIDRIGIGHPSQMFRHRNRVAFLKGSRPCQHLNIAVPFGHLKIQLAGNIDRRQRETLARGRHQPIFNDTKNNAAYQKSNEHAADG